VAAVPFGEVPICNAAIVDVLNAIPNQ
jgi:hypothetical protein